MTPVTKKEWREHARREWRNFLKDAETEKRIVGLLREFLKSEVNTESRILVSIALPDELDCMPALSNLTQEIYAPVTEPEGKMQFRLFSRDGESPSPPVPGFMNIPGPSPRAELLTEPLTSMDIALIPTMAADSTGRRLGRGGGYYDRWKNRLIPARKIALLPESLTDLRFPAEDHDLRLDGIITPSGFVNPGR